MDIFYWFTLQIESQEFTTKWLEEIGPRSIGPGGMSGRITAIDVVLSDTDIMYAGTASGGYGNLQVLESLGNQFLTIKLQLQLVQ